jgi:hypothetical protein
MTRRTLELIAFFAALLLAAMAFHAWLASHDEQQRLQSTLTTQKQLLDAADARERDRAATLTQTLAEIAKLKSSTQTPEEILRELPKYLPLPQPITLQPAASTQSFAAASAPIPAAPQIQQGTGASPAQGTAPSESGAGLQPPSSATSSTSVLPSQSLPSSARTRPGSDERSGLSASPPAPGNLQASVTPSESLPTAPVAQVPAAQIPAVDLKPLFDFVQDCRACQAQLAAAKQNSADDAAKIAALTRERDAAITASKGGSFLRRLRRNALWFVVGAGAGYVIAKR